ncbi:MAG: hypothetical protein R3178_06575, partial [Rhodothermales bacterium]|nr:hypothetical protein [Rhodothermales bacterium]
MTTPVSGRLFWSVTIVSFVMIASLGVLVANVLIDQRRAADIPPVIERIQIGRVDEATASSADVASAEELSSLFKVAASRVKDAV